MLRILKNFDCSCHKYTGMKTDNQIYNSIYNIIYKFFLYKFTNLEKSYYQLNQISSIKFNGIKKRYFMCYLLQTS